MCWRKNITIKKIVLTIAIAFIVAIVTYILFPYGEGYFASSSKAPIAVYDRNGQLLMEITDGKKGLWQAITLEEVPSEFIQLLLYSEDRDFFHHCGVSIKGITRALCQNIKSMRIVYGGSTITQQLVKSKKDIVRNTLLSKMLEIVEAIRLELHFSKKEILQAYINEAYLGNNIYGFEKASMVYFDKHLSQCDLLEQAFLISMVKAPEKYNPYKNPEKIVKQARGLIQSASQSYIKLSPMQKELYIHKKVSLNHNEQNVCAPLFCLYALSEARKLFPGTHITKIYTSLDAKLHRELLAVVRNSLGIMKDKNALHAAMVIIDNKTMEIIAMIGSVDFFDYSKGQIDATLIKRQAASTMKPFAYALALDKGIFHTSSIIPDVYTQFYSKVGNYIPKNFSKTYHGPVRFAKALGCSYNIPAIYVTNTVGLVPFYQLLHAVGFDSIDRPPSFYGLGLVLGNADVTLLELANAYTIFPRYGMFTRATAIRKVVDASGREYVVPHIPEIRVLRPSTSYLITHMLSEYKYKVDAFGLHSAIHFPFAFAVKTGTSKDFKDNFVAGYNSNITCAVWAGNLYNTSLDNLPAVSGAGIILRNVLVYLWDHGFAFNDFYLPKKDLKWIKICTLSGMPASNFCPDTEYELYDRNNVPIGTCTWHMKNITKVPAQYKEWAANKNIAVAIESGLKIIFPANGSVFKIDHNIRHTLQAIPLKVNNINKPVRWMVDNHYIGQNSEMVWTLQPGIHSISAHTSNEKDSVTITVLE